MASCFVCLQKIRGESGYHAECLEELFGIAAPPVLDIDLANLYGLAASEMAGKMSISGVQAKVSLRIKEPENELEVVAKGGTHILKPEPLQFSALPQNEHLTMQLARLVSLETPPCGLVRLRDGALCYIVKRFDRLTGNKKLQVEDFCQLSEKRPKEKYAGSGEQCAKIVKKFASEPLIELRKLFRLLLFSWWTENGDLHLKNLSLITDEDGIRRLSPCYDLVCTKLVIPDDTMALPIGGRDRKFTLRDWLDFAEYCKIPERAARSLISEQIRALDPALRLISASYLPEQMKKQYEIFVQSNTQVLTH